MVYMSTTLTRRNRDYVFQKKDDEMKTKETDMRKFNEQLMKTTGEIKSKDPLVCFLYLLMRDKLPVGEISKLFVEATANTKGYSFTNGYLGEFAQHIASGLRIKEETVKARK